MKQQRIQFPPIFFVIQTVFDRPVSTRELAIRVAEAENERTSYVNSPTYTGAVQEKGATRKQFRVLVFGVGCLLHALQQLEGYSIAPTGQGMSHRRLHEIVNGILAKLSFPPLKFNSEFETQFEHGSPTFVITYANVIGVNETDALDTCRAHAALLFELLGLDRGQKPSEFASYALELATGNSWHLYQQPWYRGNLVSDFNPVSTANMMERYVHNLQSEPFLRLLVKTYADGTGEEDPGFALLRFWSVMELVADKYVGNNAELTHPDGSLILDKDGRPLTTKSKKGRVYRLIFDTGHYTAVISHVEDGEPHQIIIGGGPDHPGYTNKTELISLWDMVSAAYAIRNSIAHKGQFEFELNEAKSDEEKLAARLIKGGHADPRRFIRDHAHRCVMRELNKSQ